MKKKKKRKKEKKKKKRERETISRVHTDLPVAVESDSGIG